jgi:hypothetical protein
MDKSLLRFLKKSTAEDLQQMRYASSKLLQILAAQGKLCSIIIIRPKKKCWFQITWQKKKKKKIGR